MASIPTPEQSAREILSIFVDHFKCRPDNVLRLGNFMGTWHTRGNQSEDFDSGVQFAAENGWIEIQGQGASFRLTAEGFAQA